MAARFERVGARVALLEEMCFSREVGLGGPNQFPALLTGDRVRHGLEALHAVERFSLIEFAERGGLGLRAIQARRAGLALTDVPLVVKMHGPTVWMNHHGRRWMERPEDLAAAFCEQFAFERAAYRMTVSGRLVEEMRGFGWRMDEVHECPSDSHSAVEALYRRWLTPPESAVQGGGKRQPLVTIGVAHYNLGATLPATLASIAAQSYPALEVIVIDDGSTDADSRRVFESMKERYGEFRFVSQGNAGIGATRNRALDFARGEYFVPMDADNVARFDMVEKFVTSMERNGESAAATCYFLAFDEMADPNAGEFLYSYRPVGGPGVLASMQNVYGDGNAIFRTDALRAAGGFETDRESSWEDWEVFVKLANQGRVIDVIPEFLFYYRHRDSGFSRTADGYWNHQRVLRQFVASEPISGSERRLLWEALVGFQRQLERVECENAALRRRLEAKRHRLADWMHRLIRPKKPG